MREQKPPLVINSANVIDYKLPKDILAKFTRFDQLRSYQQLGGRMPANIVRLFRADFVALDAKVKAQSLNKFDARSVNYHGCQIVPMDEEPKPFELEPAA